MKKIGLLFFISLSIAHAEGFNNSSFKGNYAFRLSGPSSIVLANEPLTVATGLIVADGSGHVTGHGAFRSAGITCMGTIKGIYNLQSDGTGLLSSIISTSTPGCFPIVLDTAIALSNNGNTFDISNTENDYMIGSLNRQTFK